MITRQPLLRTVLLVAMLVLSIGLFRQYHHQQTWNTTHTWQGTGAAVLGSITTTAHWQVLWRCQHAASMIAQIYYEPKTTQTNPLHQTTTVPCTGVPISQQGEEQAPAYLALTTTGNWYVTLQLLE